EIDKAQLMRTLQQPRAARHIYAHLDDCELDSAEQNILNYWLQQVDIELSVMNQYMNGVSPDSIVYEVDTTSYPQPEPAAISDLYFGVWINSPTAFTFVNCGSNASYRNVLLHNNDLVVYPNPSHGIFNIGVKEKGNYQLTVLDATGRTVHSSNLVFEDDTNRLLDLSGKLSAGHYLLVLENGVGMMMRQVVLE
ncbi:MAG: T9SS type A sorting domain-containing protein, partial [Flavobacteriales bacterium]